MDLEIIILSKPDRESKYISYMWNLKDNTNGLIYKLETDSQIQKNSLWLQKGEGRGINWEYGTKRHTLLYTR